MNRILAGLLFLAVSMLLTGCGGDDTPNGSTGDTTPPTVVEVSPTDGATDVDTESEIRVVFSEAVSQTTINPTSVGQLSGLFEFPSDSVVRVLPLPVLDYGRQYNLQITTDVKDTAGNSLSEVYTWSFTTEPDPATTPPQVDSVFPPSGSDYHIAWDPITATFDKAMDSSTFTLGSITLAKGLTDIPGVITYDSTTHQASFLPDDTLEYGVQYTASVTTNVADTFGNQLPNAYIWSFTTAADPFVPSVGFSPFYDSAVVDSQVSIPMVVQHPVGVDSLRFFVDGAPVASATDYASPWTFEWDASGLDVGQTATLTARAYAMDREGDSDPITIIYLWEQLVLDDNAEQLPQDVARMLARTTDSLLELRYEFGADWVDAYQDTGVDLGVYFDVDGNSNTGRNDFDGSLLNGIGAEYRMILGLHGGDTAMALWTGSTWSKIFDSTEFAYHHIPDSSRVMEVGIDWSDFGMPANVRIVSINVFFHSTSDFTADWVPDQGSGYVQINREKRYFGDSPTSSSPRTTIATKAQSARALRLPNPFD